MATRTLAETVKAARLAKGWTQEDLEEVAGISQTHISQIEGGTTKMPRVETLESLSHALGLDLNSLKIEAGYPVVLVVETGGSLAPQGDATHRVIPAGMMPTPDADFDAWLHFFGELDPAIRERLIAVVEQNRAEQEGRADNG